LQLNDTKTTDNKGTLLDYLVFALDQQQKELLLLHEELPDIDQAARVNLPALQGELGKLTGGRYTPFLICVFNALFQCYQ
jgi:hypothetical protein